MISIKKVLKELAKPNRTLLWENDNPSADFTAKTINESSAGWVSGRVISDYKSFEVRCSSTIRGTTKLENSALLIILLNPSGSSAMALESRACSVSDSGFVFKDNYKKSFSSTTEGTKDNGYNIPKQIYGYK